MERKKGGLGFVFAGLVICLACFSGCAENRNDPIRQETLSREVVRLLFSGDGFDEYIDFAAENAMAAVNASMTQTLGRELTYDEHIRMRKIIGKVLMEVFPRESWEQALFPVYTKHFDWNDLEQLLHFYHTPVGSKFLMLQGTLMKEGAEAGEKLMETRQADFVDKFKVEFVKEFYSY
jgi:hypothetical protein